MSTAAQNQALIERFYTAFQKADAEGMCQCYHPDVVFQDPAFGPLKGEEARNMWRMLVERSNGQLKLIFSDAKADAQAGSAYWEAVYPFSATKRVVHNKITAAFLFKDGKIVKHTDTFSLWKWAGMALGPIGWLLGGMPFMQAKIRRTAEESLKKYTEKRAK